MMYEYKTIRWSPEGNFTENQTKELEIILNQMTTKGWEYVNT